jgi:DNA-binding protein HU-beta
MNKRDLVDAFASKAGLPRTTALQYVDAMFVCLAECMKEDDTITITRFGTFTKKRRPSRTARNPATGELMTIEPSTTVSFRASPWLRRIVDIECSEDENGREEHGHKDDRPNA